MMRILCYLVLLSILSHNACANTFKTEKWHTHNGVQVVFYPAKGIPMLDVSMAFAAGSAYDGTQYGLSTLTCRMLDQGNSGKDATAIADSLAETGTQFDAECKKDMVVFNLKTLSRKDALNQSKTIFSQIINHPDFPDDAFQREKQQQLMMIKQTQQSPTEVGILNFFQTLYQQHPYAHSANGTPETVNAINKNQLVAFYKKYYVAHNAILVLIGDIDKETAHQFAEEITNELPEGVSAPPVPKAIPLVKGKQINLKFPSSQTIVSLGQMGIDYQNPNYFPLMVGNHILGGGALTSRLSTEVREKRGLTYGVSSQFIPMPGEGPFIISLSTQNEQAAKALSITERTLRTFINDGPDESELEAAKQYITGSFPLSLESNRSIANILLIMTFYHLPDDFLDTYISRINAVTSEEIKTAFKETLNPDNLVLIKVGQS